MKKYVTCVLVLALCTTLISLFLIKILNSNDLETDLNDPTIINIRIYCRDLVWRFDHTSPLNSLDKQEKASVPKCRQVLEVLDARTRKSKVKVRRRRFSNYPEKTGKDQKNINPNTGFNKEKLYHSLFSYLA